MFSGPVANLSTFYETNYNEDIPTDTNVADDLIAKATAYNATIRSGTWYNGDKDEIDVTNMTESIRATGSLSSNLQKLMVVFNRNLKNQYLQNITNVVGRLLGYSATVLVGGMMFYNAGGIGSFTSDVTFEQGSHLVSPDVFLLITCYLLPFTSIPVFVGDKRFFATDSALDLYSPWMYCCSQIIFEFAFVILAFITQSCILIPMCALQNPSMYPWVSFLTILSVVIVSGLVGSTMVFFCCMCFPSQDLAFLAASTIVTIFLALSGGYLPFNKMTVIPFSLQWLIPVEYFFCKA